jgi:AhpD family alkylhydroperoxidase
LSYVEPPRRVPFFLRIMLFLVEKRLGRELLANRIMTWYPKALVGSGVMEALVAHDEPEVPKRLLGLIRIRTSFLVSCPFCIDMNAKDFAGRGITDDEIRALQGALPLESVPSITAREKAALRYVDCISSTPLSFRADVIDAMKAHFSERGMVIVASTCAQVNFWARLIQSLGVPPAGFSAECAILDLEGHATMKGGSAPGPGQDALASRGRSAPM